MVKTKHQLHVASALGRCVAIADDNDFIGVIGDPVALGDFGWMEEGFFEGVRVSVATQPIPERIAQLRVLFPRLFDGEGNEATLLGGGSVSIGELGPKDREQLASDLGAFAPELKVSGAV